MRLVGRLFQLKRMPSVSSHVAIQSSYDAAMGVVGQAEVARKREMENWRTNP